MARSTRKPVVENFRRGAGPGGRVVGLRPGPAAITRSSVLADAREVGLNVDNTYCRKQMHPFVEGSSEFLVAVLSRLAS